tara:strand:- start:407 stop:796 length:390 start_codon:yes stop_codon:yes gene_type:complete
MEAQHLIADLRCDQHLNDPACVAAFMRAVIVVSGLHTRHFRMDEFKNGSEFGAGVTGLAGLSCERHGCGNHGFAVLSESHMVVHTAPERQMLNIDLFSCKPFGANQVWHEIAYRFGIQETILWTVIERA